MRLAAVRALRRCRGLLAALAGVALAGQPGMARAADEQATRPASQPNEAGAASQPEAARPASPPEPASAASPPEPAAAAPAGAEEEPEKRQPPDYDGRGGPPSSPGRALLWGPRLLLLPAYVTTEYLIRRPLGFVITAAEKAKLPTLLYDFFVFGPDHKAGIVPIALIDFGFQPSVGLYAFWDDAGFQGHDLRLRGSTWGSEWLAGTATERFQFSEQADLTLTVNAVRRPDYAFYGIGPDTRETSLSRYAADKVDARAIALVHFGGASSLETAAGYRSAFFSPGNFGTDPSVDERIAAGELSEPPGYRDGYRGGFSRAKLVLDTRGREGHGGSSTGARIELQGEHGTDFHGAPVSGWLRYGVTAGGILDLADSGRLVSLSLATLFADPVGSRAVPFTELVALGGPGMMPGFRDGRLYDRSAMVATLRYSWPIWIWLNGSLQAATGNVFGEHLSGLRPERSRFSGALGIEGVGSRDSVFQALIGFGTETFESGAELDSLRVVVGARSGF